MIILFLLAISDLIVGVSNDAVNFLVSAIGSKAASWGVIMLIASLGVLLGATFSSGMMEIARKGIFNPEMFTFHDVMLMFLAVMFTDIILLDTFNTLGLPTSTTVSIIFELIGASLAIALIKIYSVDIPQHFLGDYINTAKALAIIGGILFSVIVAFSFGVMVQGISRLIFSFRYEKTLKMFGAVWAGLAATSIAYFILIKGAKGVSFMTEANISWIKEHTMEILVILLISMTVIMQLLQMIFKVNSLKIVVLFGTFALAMAFAGNDLVNFIGVPLAGLKSYELYAASNGNENLIMSGLNEAVKTPTLYLLIAGFVMVLTLWFSKKARTVTKTSINLSRQDAGYERFGSTQLSRGIVRYNVRFTKYVSEIMPSGLKNYLNRRFEKAPAPVNNDEERPAFDLIRASVNLVVSSILIAIGTSLKLPLSTTYVTFMVAMGTSLSDGAWGRESAVYRVSGVLSVIGGWFVTAFAALSVSMILAIILYFGGFTAILITAALVVFLVFRSQVMHRKKEQEDKALEDEYVKYHVKESTFSTLIKDYNAKIIEVFNHSLDILDKTFNALQKEDRKLLQKQMHLIRAIDDETKNYKTQIHEIISNSNDRDAEKIQYFVQIIDYLREYAHALTFIVKPSYEHIENNHQGFSKKQSEELLLLVQSLRNFIELINLGLQNMSFTNTEDLRTMQQNILDNINASRLQQLKRIKQKSDKLKVSMLFIDILAEFKNLALFSLSLLKIESSFKERSKLL